MGRRFKFFDRDDKDVLKKNEELQIEKLFESWHCAMSRLEDVMDPEDLPYVYGERPHVGIIAAAAWENGWVVLEDFGTLGTGDRPRARPDLWIGKSEPEQTVDIEAKQTVLSLKTRGGGGKDGVKVALDKAMREVGKIKYKANYSVGLVFVRLKDADPKSFDAAHIEKCFCRPEDYGADFSALHLSERKRWQYSSHPDCPGILIVGKYGETL